MMLGGIVLLILSLLSAPENSLGGSCTCTCTRSGNSSSSLQLPDGVDPESKSPLRGPYRPPPGRLPKDHRYDLRYDPRFPDFVLCLGHHKEWMDDNMYRPCLDYCTKQWRENYWNLNLEWIRHLETYNCDYTREQKGKLLEDIVYTCEMCYHPRIEIDECVLNQYIRNNPAKWIGKSCS